VLAARLHLHACHLCEWHCGVNRLNGEFGGCKAGPTARLFRHRVEYSEELELVPSHIFYLSGCDLRCAFCIAEENAFDPRRGEPLTSDLFNQAVRFGKEQGARNVQWLGGEATIHLPHILEIMAQCPEPLRVVWKSNFHGTPESFELIRGVVDVYVADFKFGNDQCAQRLSGTERYWAIVTRNLRIAAAQGDLIVRHLVMPGHVECCLLPVVEWLRGNMPEVKFSLRDGYMPAWRATQFESLGRMVRPAEFARARSIAAHAGLNLIE
jgi:putative pyruvate formate lyase activating enzyme